jgi:hypothetical protein
MTLICLFLLIAFAVAQIEVEFTMPASFYATPIVAGSVVNLTWQGATGGPTALQLMNGLESSPTLVATIACGLSKISASFPPQM